LFNVENNLTEWKHTKSKRW